MSRLEHLEYQVRDTAGNRLIGAELRVYREGATVNGAQTVTAPSGSITVRSAGRLSRVAGSPDSVFVNAVSGTTYSMYATSDTAVAVSGLSADLVLAAGDRLIPDNTRPVLYPDDQGAGTPVVQPMTTDANGYAHAWHEFQTVETIVSGSGITTRLIQSQLAPTEAPGQVRYADAFAALSSTGGIQEAINDLPAAGGTVYVTGGKTYTVTATAGIVPVSGLSLVSIGGSATIQRGANINNLIAGVSLTDVTVAGIVLDGNKANFATGDGDGVEFDACTRVRVRDCEVKNFIMRGINFTSAAGVSDDIWIQDNHVHDIGTDAVIRGHGIVVQATSAISGILITNNKVKTLRASAMSAIGIQISGVAQNATLGVISNNIVSDTDGIGIQVSAAAQITVNGNNTKDTGQGQANLGNGICIISSDSVTVDGNTVQDIPATSDHGIELASTTPYCTNVVVNGNTIKNVLGSTRCGISAFGSRLTFTNNIVSACGGTGIEVGVGGTTQSTDIVITGNQCHSNGDEGICAVALRMTIANNVCISNTGRGIRVREGPAASGLISKDFLVTGNVCRSNERGILITTTATFANFTEFVCSNNTCSLNTAEGIEIIDCDHFVLSGNNCATNGESGIILEDVTYATVLGNHCRNNGTAAVGASDDGITLFDLCNNLTIIGNVCSDDQGTPTQAYGIDVSATATNCEIHSNILRGNLTGAINGLTQNVTAVGQALVVRGSEIRLTADASYTLTAAPTIADGYDTQRITIMNVDTVDTITLQDQGTLASSNLRLSAATIALAPRDSIILEFSSTINDWVQVGQTNVV